MILAVVKLIYGRKSKKYFALVLCFLILLGFFFPTCEYFLLKLGRKYWPKATFSDSIGKNKCPLGNTYLSAPCSCPRHLYSWRYKSSYGFLCTHTLTVDLLWVFLLLILYFNTLVFWASIFSEDPLLHIMSQDGIPENSYLHRCKILLL